jgi:cytoskeleton protein RodZ
LGSSITGRNRLERFATLGNASKSALFGIDFPFITAIVINSAHRRTGPQKLETWVTDELPENEEFHFKTVGEQLKDERLRREMSLADIAADTRIPTRHLEAIENSEFGALPGATYAVGFTRSYARSLEMDESRLISELRAELAQTGHNNFAAPTQNFEPADPSRVPPMALAWAAAAIAALLLVGYLVWRSSSITSTLPAEPVAAAADTTAPVVTAPVTPAAAADPNGEVVLTATEEVWLKIYDADGKRLFENTMKANEQYRVPKDANGPMILTGRPDALTVTVGGKPVPTLGTAKRTISDVGISASALLARKPEESAIESTPADAATANPPTSTTR